MDSGGNREGSSSAAFGTTERERSEKEIRETNALLATLVESLQVAIIVESETRCILRVNQEFCDMFGIDAPPQYLVGMDCSDSAEQSKHLFADPEGFVRHVEEIVAQRRSVKGEALILADGRELERDYVPIFVDESYRGHLWQYRDVTGRKRAEREVGRLNEELEHRVQSRTAQLQAIVSELRESERRLRESEERFSLVVRGSNDGIWDWDLTTGELYWNDRLFEMLGLSRSEVVPSFEKYMELVHPEDRRKLSEALTAQLERGAEFETETRLKNPAGGYRTCLARGEAYRDEHGTPIRMAGTLRDVTERKRSEEALRQSEERHRAVIEQTGEGIFLFDPRTKRILEANPAFQSMFGYATEELLRKTLYDLIPHDTESVDRNIERALEQGQIWIGERRYRRKDGSLVDVEVSGSVISYGGEQAICSVVRGITERKRSEEKQRFLGKASEVLSSSLDYRRTLSAVARLAVPELADWCAVDVAREDGPPERLAVVHSDPEKVAWAHKLQERYPPDPDAPQGAAHVLRTGRPEFYPEITDETLEAAARDPEHLRLMREVGFTSAMLVPLVARGKTLGVITLVSAESGRRYDEEDLGVAEELARRAALAIDNALLYEEAQKEISERRRAEGEIQELNKTLERRVEERTAQLEEAREAAEAANRPRASSSRTCPTREGRP